MSEVRCITLARCAEDNCKYNISFLKISSKVGHIDRFYFLEVENESKTNEDKVKGVLGESIRAKIARFVLFKIALTSFHKR